MKTGITLEEALSRASDGLRFKIGRSVELLRRAERLARMYDPENGFYLAFSGGKDSQALYHVAEIAGVPFASHFSPTTVDPPEVIKFIRRNYPETEFGRPEMSIYDMAVKKGMLPTRVIRWCCAEFKEKGGAGKVTLIGVRRAESVKRSKRDEISLGSRKFSGSMDEFNGWREEELARKKNFDQFSDHEEQMVSCISGKDKIIVSPLLEWTSRDVWEFLNDVMRVPHCELYDQGFHRIGCIGCPMARPQEKRIGFERWPHVKRNWIRAINQIIDSKQLVGGGNGRLLRISPWEPSLTLPRLSLIGGRRTSPSRNGRTSTCTPGCLTSSLHRMNLVGMECLP